MHLHTEVGVMHGGRSRTTRGFVVLEFPDWVLLVVCSTCGLPAALIGLLLLWVSQASYVRGWRWWAVACLLMLAATPLFGMASVWLLSFTAPSR